MPNVEALEQLKRVVLDAPDDRFRMDSFDVPNACGTTRCAAGWAADDPWFQENTAIGKSFPIGPNGLFDFRSASASTFEGLREIFDLGDDDISAMFFPNWRKDITKAEVIANIDLAIAGDRAVPYDDDDDDEDWDDDDY